MIDPAVAEVAKLSVRALMTFVGKRPRLAKAPSTDAEAVIARNVVEALQRASTLQIFGMTAASDPESSTIPLRLAETPRRFRGEKMGEVHAETHILESLVNIVLLGDPGSGKTTTLKRLTKQLVTGTAPDEVLGAIPIVVRFRDMAPDDSILGEIASRLALRTELRHAASTETSRSTHEKSELFIGLERGRDVIAEFLGENRTLLILDGLDEFPGDAGAARKELNWLARVSQQSQVIVSCRSGDFYGALEGFQILELCPLLPAEIDKVIDLSGVAGDSFRRALENTPYSDLVDRPLFLAQLLLIYRRYDYLPRYASDTYSLIVSLMLREWDAERSIRRHSQYAAFSSDRKRNFLAAVSYYLTYRVKLKSFTTRDLDQVYTQIHSRFDLPKKESHAVVAEIESHTGLIVAAGFDRYEFSHLSLQEYLAADYISREAHSLHIAEYLREYPAPIAVALTLVSDASGFFGALFLTNDPPPADVLRSFIRRVLLEAPNFEPSTIFGAALVRLFERFELDVPTRQSLTELLALNGAKASLAKVFTAYHRAHITDDMRDAKVSLQLVEDSRSPYRKTLPETLRVSERTFFELVEIAQVQPQDRHAQARPSKGRRNKKGLS